MKCHCCASEEIKKAGSYSNRNRTVRRFQCLRCGKSFSESQPLDGVRIDSDKAAMVVNMLCEGVGVRAIARLAMLNKNTVLNILETAGQHCEQFLNAKLRNLPVSEVQIDETFGFVNCLQANTDANDPFRGDQYAFLAFERKTKLLIHWEVGKRSGDTARTFLEGLKGRVTGRFQLTSDGFVSYCGRTHNGVAVVFGNEIDYGIEMKVYAPTPNMGPFMPRRERPVVLQSIKRIPMVGKPDRSKMTVNHIERQNLTMRLFNRRFTRKTLGYSKILRNHRFALALQIAHFNFCRIHSTTKLTPAVASGLTDHTWTVKELLAMTA